MRITEIYISIQGETQYAGLPCTLVRTTGCDLRCGYCDSAFAFHGGTDMSLDQIMAEVARLGAPLVLLTGGEPMLQRELPELARRLLRGGYQVMIETSGAHPLDTLPEAVVRVIDVKTPGSGESHRNRPELLRGLRPGDAVKFVLVDEADYTWAAQLIREHELGGADGGAAVARPWPPGPQEAGRMDAPGPPSGPPQSAAPQVHLGA